MEINSSGCLFLQFNSGCWLLFFLFLLAAESFLLPCSLNQKPKVGFYTAQDWPYFKAINLFPLIAMHMPFQFFISNALSTTCLGNSRAWNMAISFFFFVQFASHINQWASQSHFNACTCYYPLRFLIPIKWSRQIELNSIPSLISTWWS